MTNRNSNITPTTNSKIYINKKNETKRWKALRLKVFRMNATPFESTIIHNQYKIFLLNISIYGTPKKASTKFGIKRSNISVLHNIHVLPCIFLRFLPHLRYFAAHKMRPVRGPTVPGCSWVKMKTDRKCTDLHVSVPRLCLVSGK